MIFLKHLLLPLFILSFSNMVWAEKPALPKAQVQKPAAKIKTINWYKYEKGMQTGKKENRKVFLHFYADWCHYCKKMNMNTFTNQELVSYLNANFISIRVNSDKNIKLAKEYGVRGLPSTWFLEETGKSIGNRPGYITPDVLLSLLKYIHSDSFRKMTFTDFLQF